MAKAFNSHLGSLVLCAPAAVFIFVFFVLPLAGMMKTSVMDTTISNAFPALAREADGWSPPSPPTEAMRAALVSDLQTTTPQVLGDAVRRLNASFSGFRSLMSKTTSAIRNANGKAVDLSAVDPRWQQPEVWSTIVDGLRPYTDQFLLAAVDYGRGANGSIEPLPPSVAANQLTFGRTFAIAGIVTGLCLLIGYPYAMLAASVEGVRRQAILLAAVIPMWTSVLVRTAAWFILLQDQGLINGALRAVGILDGSLPLLFNRFAVVLAMTHILLPFMVLPIFNVLISIPRNLLPAAAALGANPLRAFMLVTLPLSLRGIASGCLLVFMASIGFYILPALLGGAQDQLISSTIAFYALSSANWQMASALGLVLFAVTAVLYYIYNQLAAAPQGRS
ncbi:ABC transporter permease [Sinorhizobium meliloti]|nr:ABC transporter permease [Sinorhizobium meliloti]MQV24903.1 ABC transporter permease subunit [Sinorhizobium meliloti]MQV37427.1 ABC transporter permease subunit [Sinorhizobium meliloti]MQW20080.1 ABC transporter permease subunit [Sinorhizobium meliloti]RVE79001.1 ABC transporter permease [Sinorhizobium meliloti]RVG42659.1 ABC transporter permease [Sinorhizobium meliloti]